MASLVRYFEVFDEGNRTLALKKYRSSPQSLLVQKLWTKQLYKVADFAHHKEACTTHWAQSALPTTLPVRDNRQMKTACLAFDAGYPWQLQMQHRLDARKTLPFSPHIIVVNKKRTPGKL